MKYLDDKPVFEEERRFATAFFRGGIEEERRERDAFRKEQEEFHMQQHEMFRRLYIDKQTESSASTSQSTIKTEEMEIYYSKENSCLLNQSESLKESGC